MSDYRGFITVKTADGGALTSQDRAEIEHALGEIASSSPYQSYLGDDFLFTLSVDEGEPSEGFVLLSEYWYGEGNDEELFELAEETDLPQAQAAAEALQERLGVRFHAKGGFGEPEDL